MNDNIVKIAVRVGDEGPILKFRGRNAWTLHHLIESGERGVTPIDRPAPRWSQYVMLLRRAGLVIETIEEKHGGTFAGDHGRYVLRSPVRIIEKVAA